MEAKVDDFVKIAIRIRPSQNILEGSVGIRLLSENPPVLYAVDRQQSYTFDNIFDEDVNQEQIYERMVKPLVDKVFSGYNCTVFAYGQTGTGKTYTIGSNPETYKDAGFILRTFDEFFDNQEEHKEIDISISFFEIYNEKVFDLLNNKKTALTVKAFKIQGLTQAKVNSSYEARNLLKIGSSNRHTGETKQNRNSSRSHAIFTIHCKVKHENYETEAKLNLVDLAGSESARRTGNEGSQFQEGVNINKGLFHVGRVISALSTNMSYIPYRQSVITTILQDSLDRRNYITLVACISPDSQDIIETIQTLEFAQGAKKLKNKPEVNSVIQQYKKDNPSLFERPLLGSAVKARPTPLKRQNYLSLECAGTPSLVKKPKLVNNTWTPSTNTIAEERINLVNHIPSPPALFSLNVSSISHLNDITPAFPPLSPIVRKCTEAVENSMMEKLGIFMKAHAHMIRPSPDKRDTPQFFKRLESTVTQIVRSEIVQLTSQQRSRACSSPIGDHDISYISGRFAVRQDTMLSSSTAVAKRLEFEEDPLDLEDTVFKVPIALPRKALKKKKSQNETVVTESELDGPSTSAPRRSTRLSLQKSSPVMTQIQPTERRRSARLLKKKASPQPSPRLDVPTPAPRKRASKRKASETEPSVDGSPMSNHTKYILKTLNTGSQKDLQKLPSIGPKTAAQIYFYRQLNGQFNSIADLGKMESWRGTAYQRFLKANFIKLEDDD